MYGIVTILDGIHADRIRSIWRRLRDDCALHVVVDNPVPHISWHVSEYYNKEELETALRKIADQQSPLIAHTAGLGLFTSPSSVFYVNVVKSARMVNLHQSIWCVMEQASDNPNMLFSPEHWVPHITLAVGDLQPDKLACALQSLQGIVFDWQLELSNLALIGSQDSQIMEHWFTVSFKH